MRIELVGLACLLAVAAAFPQDNRPTTPPVPIISQENQVNYDGSFKYSFEGGDGTRASQEGSLKSIGNEAGEVSQGSYSYVGPDGITYSVQYIADENGYHVQGDHLPTPPPIPEAIRKSLEFLATAPPTPPEPQQPQQQQYQQQQQQQQQYQRQ